MNHQRVTLFGYRIDAVDMAATVAALREWVAGPNGKCRYVVTPNVHHTVQLQRNEAFRRSYADADLVVADGMPIVAAARLLGRPLPERVAGSDLVPALFDTYRLRANGGTDGLRVYLLGAAPSVAERAANRIETDWPGVRVAGRYSPPFGFESKDAENDEILARIADAKPDVVIVGLGAPKQELWVHAHRERIAASVALCVGATIDFLAGEKPRAPLWMRKCGLEWLHRLASEPRRLVSRYARDAFVFPQLLFREVCLSWRGRRLEANG
jgi:N-acetylglucosaminyldiphosphoundecaprenol N-acetyl-beta-D-mannosaminyltransferase